MEESGILMCYQWIVKPFTRGWWGMQNEISAGATDVVESPTYTFICPANINWTLLFVSCPAGFENSMMSKTDSIHAFIEIIV